MISPLFNHLPIPYIIALFLAIAMGGSGTAPAFSAAYGANVVRESIIVKNTGKEIVLFGKFEAVVISFVSASLLLFASITKGIPTSLVQLNLAAILGIGVAKLGTKNIFRKTEVKRFFLMWIIAPIIAFILSLLLVFLAEKMECYSNYLC